MAKKGNKKKDNKKDNKKKLLTQSVSKKEEALEVEGVVIEALRGRFRIEICEEGQNPDPEKPGMKVLATLAGKMRTKYIKVVQGDRVKVELSPYDITRGRITYRLKTKK